MFVVVCLSNGLMDGGPSNYLLGDSVHSTNPAQLQIQDAGGHDSDFHSQFRYY